MAWVEVSNQIQMRDQWGRYEALLDEAGIRTAEALVEHAANDAADRAPVGPGRKDYGRRPKLNTVVEPVMTSPKVGVIRVAAGHAGAQEHGAEPHWIPNAFGLGITVLHPGNPAQPYIRPAILALKRVALAIAKRYYP